MSSVASQFRVALLCAGAIAGLLPGCQNQPSPTAAVKTGAATTATKTLASDSATEMLSSALFQVQPENLGIDSNASSAVSVLNSWREQTPLIRVEHYGFTADTLRAFPKTWLSESQRERMLATEFFPGDAVYIRNALLTAAMARSIADRQASELDRAVALFDYTLRNITLQPAGVPQLPFPLYEILVFGQGSPDDRAWVFAALLKQQRIDAVILQSPDDAEVRLVGVLLEGEVYLFDTKLGLPIPRGDDPPSTRITRPATLKEMQAHPEWWQALTLRADQPYPWNSDQLAAADVFIISEEEAWSGRMKQLQSVLPADSSCALYDPLVDTPTLSALPQRIAAGHPGWVPEKLKFWSHPLSVPERLKRMGPRAQQLSAFFERFKVPLDVKKNKQINEISRDEFVGRAARLEDDNLNPNAQQEKRIVPSHQHLKTRTEQLLGKFAAATTHFLRIRHLAVEFPPEELKGTPEKPRNPQEFQMWMTLYQVAAADASFWSAVCKLELNDQQSAAGALQDYLKKYPRSDWTSASRYLLALVQADLGKMSEAKTAVAALPSDDPHRPGLEILLKRWDALPETKPEGDAKVE